MAIIEFQEYLQRMTTGIVTSWQCDSLTATGESSNYLRVNLSGTSSITVMNNIISTLNGSLCVFDAVSDFAGMVVGEEKTLYQYSDGRRITCHYVDADHYAYYGYNSSNIVVASRTISNQVSTIINNFDFWYRGSTTGLYNGETRVVEVEIYKYKNTYSGAFIYITLYKNSTTDVWVDNFITLNPATRYTWTAWDQIAGNGGQYRCDLTKIKDNSIGDFSAIQTGDSSDFDRISSQSSIWNIFHNMGFNEVRKIAWSGGNYMTMRLNEESSYPNQYSFTFSFYNIVTVGGEQTPTLIWQDTFPITWTGETRDTDFYLSFIYDPDEEVAVFIPVTKDSAGVYEWGWSGGLPTDVTMSNIYQWLTGSDNPEIITPYTQGTEDNGGTPGGSLPQSHIDVPTAPELGAMSSGMFTLYCPTETQLQHISQFLWSDNVIANIKKYFNNFSDNIMALYVLPYKPSNNPVKTFQVGNMASDDTELAAVEYIDDRFVSVDMGEVKIKPFWGSYLDYAPYSSLQVILPGVGVQSLDVDDIFCPADQDGNLPAPSEATIHIDYTIDLMTGVIVAFISINGELRYQFPGKLGYQIPLTGENYVRMAQGFVTAAAGLIGTVVSGGTAAPFAAPAATAGIINAMKPDVYRGGNLSGDASMLARLTPTLIYRRPNKPLLADQGEFTGFPSYKIGNLSEFSGYTEVIDAHVEGISCTDEERVLILEALKEGVII